MPPHPAVAPTVPDPAAADPHRAMPGPEGPIAPHPKPAAVPAPIPRDPVIVRAGGDRNDLDLWRWGRLRNHGRRRRGRGRRLDCGPIRVGGEGGRRPAGLSLINRLRRRGGRRRVIARWSAIGWDIDDPAFHAAGGQDRQNGGEGDRATAVHSDFFHKLTLVASSALPPGGLQAPKASLVPALDRALERLGGGLGDRPGWGQGYRRVNL